MRMSQKQKILNILSDFQIHCLTHECFIKDDRSRISELRKQGYLFDETLGSCKDKTHHHGADLKLRRILHAPLKGFISITAKEFLAKYPSELKKEPERINTLF